MTRAQWLKSLTSGAVIALLLALSYYQVFNASRFNPAVFCLQALPLLFVLPGLITGRRRAYQWCGFIILLYFVRSIILITSAQVAWVDYILLLSSLCIFTLSVLGSRFFLHPLSAQ